MTAPLSQDLRERIVHAVEGGSTMRQAARRFAVSASAAIKLMQRVRETGSTAPGKDRRLSASSAGKARGRPAGHRVGPAWDHAAGDQGGACGPRHRGEGAL